jgi:succinoglycan biosynthesis protein ExoM
MTRSSKPSVTIAMLTYRRPDDLRAAVPALLAQIASSDVEASILVVDNDPDGNAMPFAANYVDEPVRFVHEPKPGIAAARNRALAESDAADMLIFIDDDERPESGWLDHLIGTWSRTGAAAVVGPVISTFEEEPAEWITAGRFFVRRRLPTGTEIDVAATNNLLLDMEVIRRFALAFDERFSASGGSDTFFTREIHRRGGRMIWCDEAIVVDVVPTTRANRRWVLQRALRTGNSWSRTSVALEQNPITRLGRRLLLSAQGMARIVGGAGRMAVGTHQARGTRTLARGAGMTSGAWGYTYVEYRRRAS